MRRLLAIFCCIVLATTLVARGGRVVCPGGMDCCDVATAAAPTTAPATAPAGCCEGEVPPSPLKSGEPHAGTLPFDMPCCVAGAWDVPAAPASLTTDALVAARLDAPDAASPSPTIEPATPPPRAAIG